MLGDEKKRALYDEFGEVALREGFDAGKARQYSQWHQQSGEGPDLNDLFGGADGQPVDFQTIFDRFFQGQQPGGARRGRPQGPFGAGFGGYAAPPLQGRDLEGEVTIDFAQAVRGGEISLNVNGSPMVVRVPPGASEGSRIRVPGRGMPPPGPGTPGDLMLTIHVRPHDFYWLEDRDLHVRVPITVGEAFNGGKTRVPTPAGDVVVTVPAHTTSGAKLRVRGKGVPATKRQPATDLIVHLEITLPDTDTPEVKAAIAALDRGYSGDVRVRLAL